MKIVNLEQGTDEWLAYRAEPRCRCGSDAATMMGCGVDSRDDLLKAVASGIAKEHSRFVVEKVFANGHRVEAVTRPAAEEQLNEELYPIVCEVQDVEVATGVFVDLLSSLDGITADYDIVWECKQWNDELAGQVRNSELGPKHFWQLEQALFITHSNKVVFTVSDGEGKEVSMEYFPVPGRAEELLRGWAQFEEDLIDYQPIVVEPTPETKVIQSLPALNVQLVGEVKSSNLVVYEQTAMDFVRSISTDLQTDEDFANAEKLVKYCQDAENELKLVKSQAQSQAASIDDLFNSIDRISEELRQKRLSLDKLVKVRKTEVKSEIIGKAKADLLEYLSAHLRHILIMDNLNPDFAGAIKGKRTVTSLHEATNDELARCKIEATRLTEIIDINDGVILELDQIHKSLFADIASIVLKDPDDFALLVKSRIDAHDAAEKEKERVKEEERKNEIRDRIVRIDRAASAAVAADVDGAQKILVMLQDTEPSTFEEFSTTATDSITLAVAAVTKVISDKEEEDKRIAEAERIRVLAEETKAEKEEKEEQAPVSFGALAEKEVEEEPLEREADDKERGLYDKFIVHRTDGRDVPGERHVGCEYFVLDLTHDRHAKAAIRAYSISCGDEFPQLSRELWVRMEEMKS